MGWRIRVYENTLRMSDEVAHRLVEAADKNGHKINYWQSIGVEFDEDAMEHMDFLWQDWAIEILDDPSVNGDVVFTSLEGDNAGEFWAYRFRSGNSIDVSAHATVVITEI